LTFLVWFDRGGAVDHVLLLAVAHPDLVDGRPAAYFMIMSTSTLMARALGWRLHCGLIAPQDGMRSSSLSLPKGCTPATNPSTQAFDKLPPLLKAND